ncbi:hypothetical protein Afil01_32950 [Actinorhabdospora filicis]|uniref:Flavoprotein n=1 Tax=Actinorhabdospora filicis TaxID=1785913 RepID=A0A9W6W9Z0_9ACTN|nr:flavoprotein [Actinorhabdospora filicis]GLZ78488.1 hypothetical protein Afil01_32950 [Actinorhabdospora filicis]
MNRVVHIIGCAAPPVLDLAGLLDVLAADGWTCCIALTPTAARWVDTDILAARTGHPVRVEQRLPGERDPFPPPDALLAAPLTFNTLNHWGSGHNHNVALGQLNRALGRGIPIVAVPAVSADLRAHPAYGVHLDRLVGAGVLALDPDEVTVRRPGGEKTFDWEMVAKALASRLR